jgi:hypothetical protein
MCKKPYFLISFVLVLGLSSTAWAWTDIDDPNYNLSFEYDVNFNQLRCHGPWDLTTTLAWNDNEASSTNVEIDCPNSLYGEDTEDCHCKDDPATDGMIKLTMGQWGTDSNLIAWQTLDPAIDGNTIIQVNYEYRMLFDTFKWENPSLDASLYYGYIPDNNSLDFDVNTITSISVSTGTTYQTFMLSFIAEAGQPYIGEPLGIRFMEQGDGWYWIDNVRVQLQPLTKAREPEPASGAVNLPKSGITLRWVPGMHVADNVSSHEVYFGTDETAVADANTNTAGIYRGNASGGPDANDKYYYTLAETLPLGQRCYWRVDEVNEGYAGPNPPANGRWTGDVWNFRVEGHAYDPSPADGAVDVPFMGQSLNWTAGTDATGHDVYFGTDEDAVADANTNSPEYKYPTQPVGDTDWPMPALTVDTTYFWRIDEQSAVHPSGLKGDIWRFTVGPFLILDNFDQYTILDPDMYAVWDDWNINSSDAQLGLQTGDMNYIRGGEGKSMQVEFANTSETGTPKYFIGSWVDCQDLTELDAGGDWTVGGVKAMTLYLIGDPCNRPHVGVDSKDNPLVEIIAPWVEVEDTSSNTGWVAYDSPTNMFYDDQWFEWNIDLGIFDACGVTLSAIDRLSIGFGGDRVGQGAKPTDDTYAYVHIDDIRLYPPRCIPEYAREVGNLTEGDCDTDGFDLEVMTRDWVITDKMAQAAPPADLGLVRYAFDEGTGPIAENDGEFGSAYDLTIGDSFEWDVNGNFTGNLVSNPNNTPTWFNDPCRGWCLYFDGEEGQGRPGEEPTALGGDYLLIPPLNLNRDTVTITAWVYPQPTFGDGDEMMDGYTGIVMTRTHYGGWGIDGNTTAGLSYGAGPGDTYDGSMGYVWNDNASDTWGFETEIYIEPLEWNFLALTIEPSQAVCYRVSQSGTLESATNAIAHDAEEFDFYTGIATDWHGITRFFKGRMSDVRIYGRTLTIGEIMGLGGMSGDVYVPNTSVANISPKDPDLSPDPNLWDSYDPNNPDIVNFLDYDLLAKNWLEEYLWPPR